MKLFSKEIDKKLFKQYPKGADLSSQVAVAKIFNPYGKGRWYLINSDPEDPNYLWAIVQMGDIVEVGSVSRNELESLRIPPFRLPLERDLGFGGVNAAELFKGLRAGKFYKAGGWTEGSENKEMLLNQAEGFEHHAEEFESAVKKADYVPAWVVAKSQRASTDLSDITHYLDGENEQREEEMEGEEEYANGGEVKWQDAHYGDNALVVSENKMGIIIKPYGRKFHLKFADGTEKTYDANELKFFKDMDDFDMGGEVEGVDLFEDYENIPENVQQILDNYADAFEDGDYKGLEKANKALLDIGYTFEYGLDGQAYDLRKVGEKGKSESYAQGGKLDVGRFYRTTDGRQVRYLGDSSDPELGTFMNKNQEVFKVRYDEITGKASLFAEGGKTDLDKMYKEYENQRTTIRLKIATILGLDRTLEYLNRDFVVSPFNLIESAVRKGFITIDEINENLWEAAVSESNDIDETYRDSGEGIGSSDMNAFISSMLNSAGIKVGVVDNKYQRLAKGGEVGEIIVVENELKSGSKKIEAYLVVDKSNPFVLEFKNRAIYCLKFSKVKEGEWHFYNVAVGFTKDEFDELKSRSVKESINNTSLLIGVEKRIIYELMKYEIDYLLENGFILDPLMIEDDVTYSVNKIDDDMYIVNESFTKKGKLVNYQNSINSYSNLGSNVFKAIDKKYKNAIENKDKMAMGGKVKFADKVKSIKASLLKRKKVSPKVQKDYGKTYSPKEAEESAKRIVGAMTAKERLMAKRKKSKK